MKRLLAIKNIDRENPGLFKVIAEELGMEVIIINLSLGESLPRLTTNDILLILGGPMGISDLSNPKYLWLNSEIDIIKSAIELDIPFIGVCLGAQLLAYALGGNTIPLIDSVSNTPLPEIGWSNLSLVNNEYINIFNKIDINELFVLHWHGDKILLPKSSKLLASSERCLEQMFSDGTKLIGLQFHVEVLESDYIKWINEDSEFIRKGLGIDADKILFDQIKYLRSSIISRKAFIRNLLISLG